MSQRDQISIASQSILWVAGVGVGLLTLAFVLGVQVGKQSAALRRPLQKGVEEELRELPEPLLDQLKLFEGDGTDKLVPAQKVDAAAPKAEPKAADKPAPTEAWTLQLIATAEAAEAKRVADKAKAAGFTTSTVKEKNQFKVRLSKPADRAAMDKAAEKLKKAGFKPFAVKVE
jgi:cell division protein FtsN